MGYGLHIVSHLVLFLGIMTVSPAFAATERPVVIELFTSQGCSSCPPADKILGALAKDPNLLPLSFHVDYWNWLGWKDPFSHADYTARQSSYNRSLHLRGNYTPQMIIDGKSDVIGSYHKKINKLIDEAKTNNVDIPITLKQEYTHTLTVSLPSIQGKFEQATLWLIGYDNKKSIHIGAGENRGKTITYHNVVNHLEHIGTYNGEANTLHVSYTNASDHIAVLLQQSNTGNILSAAVCCR